VVLRRDLPNISITTPDGTRITSDGTSTASDGARILADGSRVTAAGAVISTNPDPGGPYIPPNATPLTAAALHAVGWKFRPAGPAGSP
jgi:hypothetical protein